MGSCHQKEYTLQEKVEFLRATPFFLHLSARQLQHLGHFFKVRQVPKSTIIYRQDEKADEYFIIAEGDVKMTARGGPSKKDQFLCSKKTGDFFGERAVCEEGHIRPATVRATSDCKLMYINRTLWQRYLLQAGDQMKDKVTKIMGERMPEVLKKISFLNDLSEWKLELLGNLFRYDTVEEGQNVFEEGENGRELYIVSHGSVRVTAKDNENNDVLFQTLHSGDYFGEIALMVDMPRTATVTAAEKSLLLVLGLEDFRNFLNVVPDLKENFQQAVRERITKTLKKFKVPFFQSIPQDRYHELAAMCSIHKYEAKQVIFKEGDPGTAFYLIVHGDVKVVGEEDGKVLARLSGGAYFGEIALVTDKARTATVIVEKRAVLLSITKKDFMSFFAHNEEAYAEFALKLSRYDVPLESVLLHPHGLKYFEEHLKTEYSAENLKFYQLAKYFRENKGGDNLEEQAQKLASHFIVDDAPEQVNIPDNVRKEVIKKLEEGKITNTLFVQAQAEVLKLMSADSFKRFKEMDNFKKLLAQVGSYADQDSEHRQKKTKKDKDKDKEKGGDKEESERLLPVKKSPTPRPSLT